MDRQDYLTIPLSRPHQADPTAEAVTHIPNNSKAITRVLEALGGEKARIDTRILGKYDGELEHVIHVEEGAEYFIVKLP